ncbi:MAG TPA: indolepyruvate oxidoreductase subunit beta family protein [Bauldia sp.]|nr:indolepyruvate oxidoreductase subunit beta family protein [Bauldia sp.]
MNAIARERPITIAILAIGGQGGGVLTDWLIALAEQNGWYVQATSVAGVAQRTGATIYYLEMIPAIAGRTPVLSMMPAPGDVDIVIAAELMEAGRAIQRGLVSPDRTTLITSSHRALGILEKTAPGDGIANSETVTAIARAKAKRFIAHDLQRLAEANNSVISASLFGALAASGALPFRRESFEATIRAGGKGVEPSLAAFSAGAEAVALGERAPEPKTEAEPRPEPKPVGGTARERREYDRALARIALEFPAGIRELTAIGLRHVVDFQDAAYGHLYLDRLGELLTLDRARGGADRGFLLTGEAAKYLARAMAYDDVIRVADLKTRSSRFARVRSEARAGDDEVIHVTEFMHPRVEEFCGTLPARLGRAIEARPNLARTIDRVINKGRHLRTDGILSFTALYALAGMRRFRRALLRHEVEEAHIAEWLAAVRRALAANYDLGVEVVRCRRLIKGYSDTRARGESKYGKVLSALPLVENRPDGADWIRRLREAALMDEEGKELDGALKTVATL